MFELGQVNEAEHMAQESLEFDGDRPDVLRVLAKINIIKGRPQAAAVFLNALRQIPFRAPGPRPAWPNWKPIRF